MFPGLGKLFTSIFNINNSAQTVYEKIIEVNKLFEKYCEDEIIISKLLSD